MSALESGKVVRFNDGEGCIEHFPSRHDDDVEASGHLVAPEQLAGTPFRPVPFDGGPDLLAGRDSETGLGPPIRHDEQHHETAVNPDAGAIGSFEFRPAADSIGAPEALRSQIVSPRRKP
jgi:hypothetical protein